jgi:hypothetical protein
MPDALNAVCFTQPHWMVIARGFDTERWFNDGQAVGSGGMFNPTRVHLPRGQRYYRFTSSLSPRDAQLGGGWWIDAETFHTIRSFAQRHEYGLADAARLFLALPYEWTRVDRLVSAILEAPLDAYAGKGKVAQAKGSEDQWVPIQHISVAQLYIPGLYARNARAPQLYERAFPDPTFGYVSDLGRAAPLPS